MASARRLDALARTAHLGAALLGTTVTRPSAPLKLNLCLTYWCQYRCKTCNIWQRKPTDELTTDEVARASSATNPGVTWVDLTGGEIFLRPDIDDDPRRHRRGLAAARHPALSDQRLSDRPASSPASSGWRGARGPHVIVTVSLDGDEALNDEVRGIKGGFTPADRDVHGAAPDPPASRPVLGMTLSRYNVGQVRARRSRPAPARCPGLDDRRLSPERGAGVGPLLRQRRRRRRARRTRHAAARARRLSAARAAGRGRRGSWLERSYLAHLERVPRRPARRRCAATRCAPAASSIPGASCFRASPTRGRWAACATPACGSTPIWNARRNRAACSARSGRATVRSAGPRARRTRASSATSWRAGSERRARADAPLPARSERVR